VVGGPADWITGFETLRLRAKLVGEVRVAGTGTEWRLLGEHQTGYVPQTRNFVELPAVTGRPLSDRAIRATAATRTYDIDATLLAFTTHTPLGSGRLQTITSWGRDEYGSRRTQTFPSRLFGDERLLNQDILFAFGPAERLSAGDFGGVVGLSFEDRRQRFRAEGPPLLATVAVDATTISGYADLRVGLADRLTLIAGARAQRYEDDRAISTTALFPPPLRPVSASARGKREEEVLLPSLGLGYRISESQTVGLVARRGYTPGGVAINAFSARPYEYESETLWTLEGTWRGSFFASRLRFGVTGFYNWFDNPQLYGATVPGNRLSLQVFNALRGESYGVEFEAEARIGDDLSIDAALGLLNTRITAVAPGPLAIVGNSFGQDPDVTGSIGAVWRLGGRWSLDARTTYVGEAFNDFNNVGSERVGDFATVEAGVTLMLGSVELKARALNIFDSDGTTRIVTGAGADVLAPRTLILSAGWRL